MMTAGATAAITTFMMLVTNRLMVVVAVVDIIPGAIPMRPFENHWLATIGSRMITTSMHIVYYRTFIDNRLPVHPHYAGTATMMTTGVGTSGTRSTQNQAGHQNNE